MKSKVSILLTSLVLLLLQSCYNEIIDNDFKETISVNSELYNDLGRIIENTEQGQEELICIDFLYPLTLYVFDDRLNLLNSEFIVSDQNFSDLLGNLEETHSISISYPITTTLNDGSTYSINTNEELKEVIDKCKKDQPVIQCQTLIRNCVWKVGYLQNSNNTYLGGVFVENDGATSFSINNELYFGSWSVFSIDEELHINISLNSSDEISDYFNSDWKVDYLNENALQLTSEDKTFILDQYCDTDYAECTNFNFSECHLTDNPNVAEFILDNYNYCINKILQGKSSNTNIIYFETLSDANANENAIPSNQVYLNTSTNQILYVRIENIEEQSFYTIEINIEAKAC